MLRSILVFIIKLYQKTLSPDHGVLSRIYPSGYCKYQPTCSSYMLIAIEKHGAIRGMLMGFVRIFKCHPWAKGGYDPVK